MCHNERRLLVNFVTNIKFVLIYVAFHVRNFMKKNVLVNSFFCEEYIVPYKIRWIYNIIIERMHLFGRKNVIIIEKI